MHWNGLSFLAHAARGLLQPVEMKWLPQRGGKVMLDCGVRFTLPDAAHHQNSLPNTRIPEFNAFFCAGDTEPLRSSFFERAGALYGAVAVGIRLHHGTHRGVRRY